MGQNPMRKGRGRCPLPFVAGKMPVPGQASSHGQSKERANSALAATCSFAVQSVDRGLNGSTPSSRSAQIAFGNFVYQQHVICGVIKRIKEMNSASYERYIGGGTIYPY